MKHSLIILETGVYDLRKLFPDENKYFLKFAMNVISIPDKKKFHGGAKAKAWRNSSIIVIINIKNNNI